MMNEYANHFQNVLKHQIAHMNEHFYRKTYFGPLQSFHNNHELLYNFRKSSEEVTADTRGVGCMELVIIKASNGCRRHHDQRLHTGLLEEYLQTN